MILVHTYTADYKYNLCAAPGAVSIGQYGHLAFFLLAVSHVYTIPRTQA